MHNLGHGCEGCFAICPCQALRSDFGCRAWASSAIPQDFKQTLHSALLFAKAVTLLPLHWPESNQVLCFRPRYLDILREVANGLHNFPQRSRWLHIFHRMPSMLSRCCPTLQPAQLEYQ